MTPRDPLAHLTAAGARYLRLYRDPCAARRLREQLVHRLGPTLARDVLRASKRLRVWQAIINTKEQ